MKPISFCIIVSLLLPFSQLVANEPATAAFCLTDEGRPSASIVLAKQPSQAAAFAAMEMKLHIWKVTGAELPIVSDTVEVSGPRILIGESAATQALKLNLDFKPQEYLIRFLPGTLILVGKDEETVIDLKFNAEGRLVNKEGIVTHENVALPDFFEERGSLHAVYDFLEKYCGVRWYAPGEVGLVCHTKPSLAVTGKDLRRAPAMDYRWIVPKPLYFPAPPKEVPAREKDLWKLHTRLGGRPTEINHSFGGYYERYFGLHPEWFAQGYTGRPPQMCYTSPGFIRQVAQDARDYFDGKGLQPGAIALGDVFGLVPMDNASYCKCDACQKQLDKAGKDNPQFTAGYASNYIQGFVNEVAREVRRTHPNKWIGTLGYWNYAYHPSEVKLEPNVVAQLCLHSRNWWTPSVKANDLKVLEEWRREEPDRPIYLWLYYNFPALNVSGKRYNYFPGFFAHRVVEQMKIWHKAQIRGIFLEHSSEFGATWLMDQLEFYVTFKLADDPTLDGNQLIEEFFTSYYGAAAAPMKALYCGIEDAYSLPDSYPEAIRNSPALNHQTEAMAWGALGTVERMAKFARLMEQAQAAAQTDIEKERVALFEEGIWRPMLEGRKNFKSAP